MRILDLFCGAGGVTRGFLEAGADYVVGVDANPKLESAYRKAGGHRFIAMDIHKIRLGSIYKHFDLIWASPPCQRYSSATKQHNPDSHPDMVDFTRTLLKNSLLSYVIENVEGAPLRKDLLLCGPMVGLDLLRRHRIFEIHGFNVIQPEHKPHTGRYITVAGHPGGTSTRDGNKGRGSTAEWREAMGIDWMTGKQLAEAIPPNYSKYILSQFMEYRNAVQKHEAT